MMKVKDFINQLMNFNQDADIEFCIADMNDNFFIEELGFVSTNENHEICSNTEAVLVTTYAALSEDYIIEKYDSLIHG